MGYRILADENVEAATIDVLNRQGHDVVRVQDIDALGPGVSDEDIAVYARRRNRLVLSQARRNGRRPRPAEPAAVGPECRVNRRRDSRTPTTGGSGPGIRQYELALRVVKTAETSIINLDVG